MLTLAVGGGLAWIVFGYRQHVIHFRDKMVTVRGHVLLYASEFAAAVACLTGFTGLLLRALHLL